MLSFPVVWAAASHLRQVAFLLGLWILWWLWKTTRSWFFILIFNFCLIIAILYSDGLITSPERLVWLNDGFLTTISQYAKEATYLPYRLRPWVFNLGIIPVFVFGRAFSYLWLNHLLSLFGLGSFLLLISSLTKSLPLPTLISLSIGVLTGSLAHHPNPAGFYFLMLPLVWDLLSPTISKISRFGYIAIIISNLLWLI